MSKPTVEEFLELCRKDGLDVSWSDARDYLEETEARAERLRLADIPGDTPDWFRIASISSVSRDLKDAVPPDLVKRLIVMLVLTRKALDRAETRCASLEHVLQEREG